MDTPFNTSSLPRGNEPAKYSLLAQFNAVNISESREIVHERVITDLGRLVGDRELDPELYPRYSSGDAAHKYDLAPVFRHRGKDRPSWVTPDGQRMKEREFSNAARNQVMVCIKDEFGDDTQEFGWPIGKLPDMKAGTEDPRWLGVALLADSQIPSIKLRAKVTQIAKDPKPDSEMVDVDVAAEPPATGATTGTAATKPASKQPAPKPALKQPATKPASKQPATNEETIDAYVFANSIQREAGSVSFDTRIGGEEAIPRDWIPQGTSAIVLDLLKQRKLWATRMVLNASAVPDQGPSGRPQFMGIDHTDREAILSSYKTYRLKKDDIGTLVDRREEFIGALYYAKEVTMFSFFNRVVDDKDGNAKDDKGKGKGKDKSKDTRCIASEIFASFKQYFEPCLYMAATFGNFWWYQLQHQGIPLAGASFHFDDLALPDWMVNSWSWKFKGDFDTGRTTTVSLTPKTYEVFNFLPCYPEPEVFAFHSKLGSARESMLQDKELNEMITSARLEGSANKQPMTTFKGMFLRGPGQKEHYVVHINVEKLNGLRERGLKLPPVNSHVEITVTPKGKATFSFRGQVMEDFFQSGQDVVVQVWAKQGVYLDPGEWYNISFVPILDKRAINRNFNAIEKMQQSQLRKIGVYVPGFALQVASPAGQKPGYLKDVIDGKEGQLAHYRKAIDRFGLNAKQKEAALKVIKSTTDLNLLQGPPGTGKSFVLMVIVNALVICNIKVLVTAPTNAAVNQALEAFQKVKDPSIAATVFCRYRMAYSKTTPEHDEDQQMGDTSAESSGDAGTTAEVDELSEREANRWLMINHLNESGQIPEQDEFGQKKLLLRDQWLKNKPDEKSPPELVHRFKMATEHKEATAALRDFEGKRNSPEHRHVLYLFKEAEHSLSYSVMRQMKVVFATNSTSSQITNFELDGIVMDEAGQSTPPDTFIPLASHIERAKFIVMGGDHKQFHPVVMSVGRNEAASTLQTSTFERLISSKQYNRTSFTMLEEQYRMTPDISSWISRAFYDGKLKDAASRLEQTPLQKTFHELMSKTGAAWNGRYRVAIDVGEAESMPYRGTSSICNSKESQAAAGISQMLCQFEPADPKGYIIKPADIVVVTPYLGQLSTIVQDMYATLPKDAGSIKRGTTQGMQGQEGKIVIISLTKNDPDDHMKIRFIANAPQLNVEISRSQDVCIILGNFQKWMQTALNVGNRKKSILGYDKGKKFASLLDDIHQYKDAMFLSDLIDGVVYGKPAQVDAFDHAIKPAAATVNRNTAVGTGPMNQDPAGLKRAMPDRQGKSKWRKTADAADGPAHRGGSGHGRGRGRGGRGGSGRGGGNQGVDST